MAMGGGGEIYLNDILANQKCYWPKVCVGTQQAQVQFLTSCFGHVSIYDIR